VNVPFNKGAMVIARSRGVLSVILSILVAVAIFGAAAELVIRVITKTNPETGMLVIGRVALLPYRPNADAAGASWDRASRSTYVIRDDDLGWAIMANGQDAKGYTATAHGFRGTKGWQTTTEVPKGKIRVSVYGDSFTHGDEVQLYETWADQLQQMRPKLEVLNFGVPAYGTDQAFLRFRRDGRKLKANAHILAIWPEDIARNVNVIRFFLNPRGNLGTSKPRFVMESGELKLLNSPVLSKQAFLDVVLNKKVSPVVNLDYWYREDEQRFPYYYRLQCLRAVLSTYNTYQRREIRNRLYFDKSGEALTVTVAIAKAFNKEVRTLGAKPYVAIIPMREFLDSHATGKFPLVELLRAQSIPVLDFGPAIAAKAQELGVKALYSPSGHLTALGNRVIAEELAKELSSSFDVVTQQATKRQ
jgi:hypothetical protein